jgi:hypothetical protein
VLGGPRGEQHAFQPRLLMPDDGGGGEACQHLKQLGVLQTELARIVGGCHRDRAEQGVLVQQWRGDFGVDA